MIALILSVCFSSIIMLVFKAFDKWQVKLLPAVIVNYGTCTLIGLAYLVSQESFHSIAWADWMYFAMALGALFILIFYFMGYVTNKFGVSSSTVATKMGVIIPILYGLLILNEPSSTVLILGIICSIIAVVLISGKANGMPSAKGILPILLIFVGSGVIDICLKIIRDQAQLSDDLIFLPTLLIFSSAFCLGLLLLLAKNIKTKGRVHGKSILGGIVLGVPNFFSIYFIFQALNSGLTASFFYPINNVSIVLLSTLLSVLIFKEKLGRKKTIGLAVAVLSILLIQQAHAF